MSKPKPEATPDLHDSTHCLVQSVAEVFAQEPGVEAVKIDRTRGAISVATLGRRDAASVEAAVTTRLKQIQEEEGSGGCALLSGAADCSTCTLPVPTTPPPGITVQHDAHTTTIARVTCPTAPSFWRWRDLPWPRLVPRKVLLPDEEDHEHEWKLQLFAAGLCGGFGLAAYLAAPSAPASLLYALSFVAGAWYTTHEVWERLRHGALDVHFLMLAVAVGSASIGAWGEGSMLLFLFSLSGALEHYALGRTQREIHSLFRSAPKSATVLDDHGHESEVPLDQLRTGMRLLVKPGAQFPVDAEIVKGKTASDESNL